MEYVSWGGECYAVRDITLGDRLPLQTSKGIGVNATFGNDDNYIPELRSHLVCDDVYSRCEELTELFDFYRLFEFKHKAQEEDVRRGVLNFDHSTPQSLCILAQYFLQDVIETQTVFLKRVLTENHTVPYAVVHMQDGDGEYVFDVGDPEVNVPY